MSEPLSGLLDGVDVEASIMARRARLFVDFCDRLDRYGIQYVVLGDSRVYPERIDSDVDFMVGESDFARLPALLGAPGFLGSAELVQALEHETTACYFVFAQQAAGRLVYFHPDMAASYRRKGRMWLASAAVLATRERHQAGFWVPKAGMAFEYYFVKRVEKYKVEVRNFDYLLGRYADDPDACDAVLKRLLGPVVGEAAMSVFRERDFGRFVDMLDTWRGGLAASAPAESLRGRVVNYLSDKWRMLRRVVQPTGLVLAVLGPDGSGKTTVIEYLEREIAPAFRRTERFHLRPRFGRHSAWTVVSDPHAQPPRRWGSSAAKVVYFWFDYLISWLLLIWPAKIRSTLVIFDRYFHDLLVDERRYRLPIGFGPSRWMAGFFPKPDLVLILHAPGEVLVARKGEITLEAALILSEKYFGLKKYFKEAHVIDTNQPLDRTLADAAASVMNFLSRRQHR